MDNRILTVGQIIAVLTRIWEEHGDLPVYVPIWDDTWEDGVHEWEVSVRQPRSDEVMDGYPKLCGDLPKRVVIGGWKNVKTDNR
jgi:hypothetical protein